MSASGGCDGVLAKLAWQLTQSGYKSRMGRRGYRYLIECRKRGLWRECFAAVLIVVREVLIIDFHLAN
jgi:hypothetical protein